MVKTFGRCGDAHGCLCCVQFLLNGRTKASKEKRTGCKAKCKQLVRICFYLTI